MKPSNHPSKQMAATDLPSAFKKNLLRIVSKPLRELRLLLAVSGGIDSVALARLCHRSGIDCSIAHCNFQLRGEESVRDENFVAALAMSLNMPFHSKRFDTMAHATAKKLTIQVAARELRYAWFRELMAEDGGFDYLATAHHADDNVETLLLNLVRGTGITGLLGIPEKKDRLLRPLLFAKRDDIRSYMAEHGYDWVEDSSNATDKYARNLVRHQVLPLLHQVHPMATDNLLANIERLKGTAAIYASAIEAIKKKLLVPMGKEVHVPILKLKKQEPFQAVLYELAKDFGFPATQLPEVEKLLDADNGSFVLSPTHRLFKNRLWLIAVPLDNDPNEAGVKNIPIDQGIREILFPNGKLVFQETTAGHPVPTGPTEALIDLRSVSYPLLLRPYKQGDYFYPLGMDKKKKISRFLIDQKLSKTEKEKTWVLESDKRILWVIGMRIDDRCKVKASSSDLLSVTWEKG